MVCSMFVDLLADVTAKMGCLPRRLVIQADNTPKDTRSTVALAMAVWLLVHFQRTRLQTIEFRYLRNRGPLA